VLLFTLPAVLFFGSGLLDTLLKYVEQGYLNDANKNAYLSSAFAAAATIGLLVLMIQVIRGKQKISWKNIVAGIIIGIPNYFSIWCQVKFFQVSPWESSATIPINNMGIVLFSTIAAWFLFKESLSKTNWVGILLSVIAIVLIAFGNKL
jgi:drug/metabolite transporter (DMT)-like permease